MQKIHIVRCFTISAGVLLLATAVAKLISANGTTRILHATDPILSIPFGDVFWIVGGVEFICAATCLLSRRLALQAGLVACLATNFAIYRIGLLWIGYQRPCSCLGNLTDALHISPQKADEAMKIILGYLLLGSYGALILLRKVKRESRFNIEPASAEPAGKLK